MPTGGLSLHAIVTSTLDNPLIQDVVFWLDSWDSILFFESLLKTPLSHVGFFYRVRLLQPEVPLRPGVHILLFFCALNSVP